MSEFRYHPEIEGLKVNEDGSQVFLNQLPVEIKVKTDGKKYPFHFFYYKGKTMNLAKVILECWVGPAPAPELTVKYRNGYDNLNYTNLWWGKFGGNGMYPSKISPSQKLEIIDKIKSGESGAVIAREYGVTRNAIFNIKKSLTNNGE